MSKEDIEYKLKTLLNKYKLRYRSITIEDDRLIIGAEGYKRDHDDLLKDIKKLGLQPVNIIYGRWVFNIM